MMSAQRTAQSLEDVRRNMLERQMAEHESELDFYRAFAENLSRESQPEARALCDAQRTPWAMAR